MLSPRCLSAAWRIAPIILRGWVALVNLDSDDNCESRVAGRDRLGAVLALKGDRGGGWGDSKTDSAGVGERDSDSGTDSRATFS